MPVAVLASPDLKAGAKVLYGILLHARPADGGPIRLNRRKLAEHTAIRNPRTLSSYLKILTAAGLVEEGGARGEMIVHSPLEAWWGVRLKEVELRLSKAHYLGEGLMREWLTLLVAQDKYQDNARPAFLVNPQSGEPLEYDRWYPPDVAFEFNGPQHYRPTSQYPGLDNATATMMRDVIKLGLSAHHGVRLIIVQASDLQLDLMLDKIGRLLPVRRHARSSVVAAHLEEISWRYRQKAGVLDTVPGRSLTSAGRGGRIQASKHGARGREE